ncbi:MAG: diacylglycerol kinase family protein [Acidobacteriota bacterium]
MTYRKATIIYNPMSGRKGKRTEKAKEMVRLLETRGIQAEACATTAPHDATRLAREAIANGANLIISYGGDGTLNEVIQPMVGTDVALAVWAGGTANVVAKDLHLPKNSERLADVIAAGKTRRIALGCASRSQESGVWSRESGVRCPASDAFDNEPGVQKVESDSAIDQQSDLRQPDISNNGLQTPDSKLQTLKRYFFMFAGIGLDASISRGVNAKLKRKTGEFAFWVSGIKHLFAWDAPVFDVQVDGQKYQSAFTLVGKGKGYGGGIKMAKNAKLEQPEFELFILPRHKRNIVYLIDLLKGFLGKPERSSATILCAKRIKVNSDKEIWVELDGELAGTLPMTFEAVPDALSVIVP